MGLVVTGLVGEDKQLAVKVRVLSDLNDQQGFFVPASLEKLGPESLTVRVTDDSRLLPVGALVEIITPDRYYLGEVASRQGRTGVIKTEHELERSEVEAIQAAWGTGA